MWEAVELAMLRDLARQLQHRGVPVDLERYETARTGYWTHYGVRIGERRSLVTVRPSGHFDWFARGTTLQLPPVPAVAAIGIIEHL